MGAGGAELLATDRLAEFQRLARSKGSLPVAPSASSAAAGGLPTILSGRPGGGKSWLLHGGDAEPAAKVTAGRAGAAGFMREFFDAVGELQGTLRQGRECVQRMDKMLEEVLQATTQERQKAVSDSLGDLAEATNGHIAASKCGLEALKARAEAEDRAKPSPAERRIRANMQQAMAKKHQQLLLDFQKAQLDFKQILEQRQAREMRLLCPDASPQELEEMIEAGETASNLVMRRMAGAHATILEEVQRIRDKHQDILRLERSIQDLAQMFQEIAVLVEEQGEMLDSIEKHVQDTCEYTGQGAKELNKALKIQHNTRKWQCCTSVFCMLVLVAVLWPVILR